MARRLSGDRLLRQPSSSTSWLVSSKRRVAGNLVLLGLGPGELPRVEGETDRLEVGLEGGRGITDQIFVMHNAVGDRTRATRTVSPGRRQHRASRQSSVPARWHAISMHRHSRKPVPPSSAIARGADLVILSKFSNLEAERGGLSDAFRAAVAAGLPVATAVLSAVAEAWRDFVGPLSEYGPHDAN
jgi:hypothetical protein